MPFMMGGANRNNYIPGGNNTSPKSGGNRTPSGSGSGSWVSGGHSSRGNVQNTPSYKPKTSFSQRGGNYSSWNGFSSSGKGKGLGYSPYGNNSSTSTYGNNPASRGKTNFLVKNRGTTALTKGLGGSALIKSTPAKAIPWVGAALLFFDILLKDSGIVSQEQEQEALERWQREVGSTEVVALGQAPPFTGGQAHARYNITIAYENKNGNTVITPIGVSRWGRIKDAYSRIEGNNVRGIVVTGSENDPEARIEQALITASATFNQFNNFRIHKLVRADGQPDTGGNLPSLSPPISSESTTNHSNIRVSSDTSTSLNGIKPLLSKSKIVSSSVSNPAPVPTSVNDNKSIDNDPLPVPLPLQDPPPISEKTVEEALKDALSAGIQIGKKAGLPSLDESKTISTIKVKRADGTTITVRQREATEKEVQASRRAIQRSKDAIEANKEAYYEARPWLDPKTGKRKQRFPFGEPEVPFYTEADNLGSLGNPYYKLDLEREPALKIPKQPPSSSPPSGGNKTPTGNTPIVSDDPQPDTDDKKNQLPIPPPAIQQNKEGECQGCGKALSNKLDGLNALLGGTSVGQNANILDIVRDTNRVINSPEHGLAKVQDFARTAWRVTRADKVMAGVSMVMSVHNAMMLSNNLLSTVSEATNMTLNALGIRDEEDTPIDFGAAVKEKIEAVMKNVLGETKYVELTARIAKANRIYQASINLLDTAYSLFDSARSVAELTAENTGKIGNALRDAGVVYEDAYNEFVEEVNSQNQKLRGFGKLGKTLGQVSEGVSTVTEISSEVVELKENIEQVKEEKQQLADEISEATEKAKDTKEEEKQLVQVTAEIDEVDFEVAPSLSTEGN